MGGYDGCETGFRAEGVRVGFTLRRFKVKDLGFRALFGGSWVVTSGACKSLEIFSRLERVTFMMTACNLHLLTC